METKNWNMLIKITKKWWCQSLVWMKSFMRCSCTTTNGVAILPSRVPDRCPGHGGSNRFKSAQRNGATRRKASRGESGNINKLHTAKCRTVRFAIRESGDDFEGITKYGGRPSMYPDRLLEMETEAPWYAAEEHFPHPDDYVAELGNPWLPIPDRRR